MSVRRVRIRPIPSAVVLAVLAVSASVRAVPIHGGPEYNSVTQTGYQSPHMSYDFAGSTAPAPGNGVGVGFATLYESGSNKGMRAVRWDASGVAIELGHLGLASNGNTTSRAYAINDAGIAVGYAVRYNSSGTSLGNRAVAWDASGVATELGHLGESNSGSTNSGAFAINDAGIAVGIARKYESGVIQGSPAVRWDTSGAATELGHIGGSTSAIAYAINNAGTAVGYASYNYSGTQLGQFAVRWDASGTAATELGHLGLNSSGGTSAVAYAINDAGTAVGYANKYESGVNKGMRAVRWDTSGAATELGIGIEPGGIGRVDSRAYAINAAGIAVGYVEELGGSGARALRWDISGTVATELGHLGLHSNGYYTISIAYAINDSGITVGYARRHNSSGTPLGNRAVAWGLDGVAIDLNTLLGPDDDTGWVNLFQAIGISNTYWITGRGSFDPDGPGPMAAYDRLFLLDAISLFGTPGDATRDGLVNFDDLLLLAQHYGTTAGGKWDTGDFNGDGAVDFDDLLALAQRYGTGGPSLTDAAGVELTDTFQADWTLAQSLVPEPVSPLLLAFAGPALRRRRG